MSPLDPVQPVDALRQMALDRLQAFGPAGKAVLVIENASLTRDGDTITGTFAVRLDIYTSANIRAGYAEARVSHTHTGDVGDIRQTLFDMTKQLMDEMNVQLEYQIIHSLRDWLAPTSAVPIGVQQQPLVPGGPLASPGPPPSGPPPSGPPRAGRRPGHLRGRHLRSDLRRRPFRCGLRQHRSGKPGLAPGLSRAARNSGDGPVTPCSGPAVIASGRPWLSPV